MSDCSRIDDLVTPYVDGELPDDERSGVERHLDRCRACRSRVEVERSMHHLLDRRRMELCAVAAPPALRARCQIAPAMHGSQRLWRTRTVTLALAATLVLTLLSAVIYRFTEAPISLIAAELTTDHVKCFMLHGAPDRAPSTGEVEQSLERLFGWDATLPAQPEQAGLALVGARPCLYAEGRVAHIMYRHEGRPVSVFMLPNRRRAQELVDVAGHHAVIWTTGDRTFVLVAREPPAEMDRIARFVHAGLR